MMVLKMISFNLHTEFSNAVTYLEIDSKFKDIYSFTAAFILDGYTPPPRTTMMHLLLGVCQTKIMFDLCSSGSR